jgi:hypothetical protein
MQSKYVHVANCESRLCAMRLTFQSFIVLFYNARQKIVRLISVGFCRKWMKHGLLSNVLFVQQGYFVKNTAGTKSNVRVSLPMPWVYTYTHIHIYVRTYIRNTYTHTTTYIHTYTHTCIIHTHTHNTYIHTYIYVDTYIHTYIHVYRLQNNEEWNSSIIANIILNFGAIWRRVFCAKPYGKQASRTNGRSQDSFKHLLSLTPQSMQ